LATSCLPCFGEPPATLWEMAAAGIFLVLAGAAIYGSGADENLARLA
jgi:hypothetical protein